MPALCAQDDLRQRICARLQHLPILCESTVFTLAGTPVMPASVLSSQLSVLAAVTFKTPPSTSTPVVKLLGWRLDHELLAALPALPAWASTIDLSTCEWPLQDHVYAQLAQRIPTTCGVWDLGSVPTSRLQRICHGANTHRAGLGLPRLELKVVKYKGREPQMVGEHVIVRGP